jgi:GAF domain-containing protein
MDEPRQRPNLHGGLVADGPRTWIVEAPSADSQLQSLTDASRAIAGARNLEELLRVVTEAAQSVVGTHQAITSRLLGGWGDARSYLILSDKYAEYRTFDQPPKGLGVLEYVVRENRPLRLSGEELVRHPDWRGLRDAPGHPDLPDYLAAPLVSRDGGNIGLVQLSDKTDGTPFTEDDEAALVQLALMASAAIEHVELAEQLEQGVRHARLAAEVGMALTSGASLAEKLQRCAQALVDQLDAALARIWVLEESEQVLELRASAGDWTHLDGEHARIQPGQFKIGRIFQERRPHLTNAVLGDPLVHDQSWAEREGIVAFAGHPLVVGDASIGVLALFARHPLPSSTLVALDSMADSIAVGVSHTRSATALTALLERERAAREALDRKNRLLESIDRVARAVTARLDLKEIVQEVTDAATEVTNASFGALLYNVVDERGQSFQLYTVSGAPADALASLALLRDTEIFAGTGVVRLDDALGDPRYGEVVAYHGMPPGQRPVRSYLAVPASSSAGEVMGALFFGHREPGRFGPDEERLAVGIAAYASIAMENALLYEEAQRQIENRQVMLEERERVSRALQRPLIPPAVPEIPGLEAAAIYRPFGEALDVGGDFYDIFEVAGGRWAFVVGDISGKGPDAAAVTGLARPTLWAGGQAWGDPSEMLQLLNGAVLRAATDRFCTAAIAVADTSGTGVRVRVAIGGHPRPLLLRSDGRTSWVGADTSLVGAFADAVFGSVPIVLHAGDALVLYTDGLTEGGGRQTFDDGDLVSYVTTLAGRPAAHIAEALADEAARCRQELRDDLAILVIRAA